MSSGEHTSTGWGTNLAEKPTGNSLLFLSCCLRSLVSRAWSDRAGLNWCETGISLPPVVCGHVETEPCSNTTSSLFRGYECTWRRTGTMQNVYNRCSTSCWPSGAIYVKENAGFIVYAQQLEYKTVLPIRKTHNSGHYFCFFCCESFILKFVFVCM